jgi:hypothetical protein
MGASSGSRASMEPVPVSTLSGFDPERVKYIADLRAALSQQSNRADKAERQVRDLVAENARLRRSNLSRQDVEDVCNDIFIASTILKGIPGSSLRFVAGDIADQLAPRLGDSQRNDNA